MDHHTETPIYKQLADGIRLLVDSGAIQSGEKLPATRELAGHLGLNRTTVSAAYAVLEQSGILEGHVGRGSFIAKSAKPPRTEQTDWESLLPPLESVAPATSKIQISFANSRPAQDAFPLASFRRLTKDVVDGPEAAQILQLGSPHGHPPLRRFLIEQAIASGIARSSDDLIVTNGCQQALDLLARLFFGQNRGAASGVAMEDPVYHGLVRVFSRAGANVFGIPMDAEGIDPALLEEVLQQYRPRLLVVTPSFQNPTGATLSLERRKRIVGLAQRYGAVLVENDIYSELRYQGGPLPTLKELDESGNSILLRSYSKVSFPGLRVGWVIAPQPVIARLAEAKQLSDLHSDQLSQAVLLRFAESGELARHLERTRLTGAEKLNLRVGSLRPIFAGRFALHPAQRRHEFVGRNACAAAGGIAVAARHATGSRFFAGSLFFCASPACPRFPTQFRRFEPRRNRSRSQNSRRGGARRTRLVCHCGAA